MQDQQSQITRPAINPRVDCLMLTLALPERLPFARRSIESFCRQSLTEKRLLLIINGGEESGRQALREYVDSLRRDDIQALTPRPGLNLGQLRNFSVEAATGDVLCQWDDDDLYHPQRLEKQLAHLVDADLEAVYLQEVMQYFPASKTLYWTNWRATEVCAHPGTLMVRRSVPLRYPIDGTTAHLGEDTHVAHGLIARGRVGHLAGMPHLYVYVSHGANSWHDGHHRMLANELSISQALLRRREAQLREGLAPHGLGRDGITLMGNNGPAFTL
jgi:glycosyltransferase involved in cell wall biosynthesis